MKRWAIIAGASILVLAIGGYAARAAVERYISGRLEAQRSAIQAERAEDRAALATERQVFEADKAAVANEKVTVEAKKREVAAQVAQLQGLFDHLKEFDPARQRAREDALHVPDDQVLARFRAALARKRASEGR